MRYRVLGALEVWVGDEWISLGPTKWRILLAVLLCASNEVVSADRLLEEIWGGKPPKSARKLLQGYVSQLRRQLEDGVASTLVTHKWGYQAHGYQLLIRDEGTDAQCFERLLARGREAVAEGAFQAALAWLDEAQKLWRGPPFTDVPPTSSVQTEIARLEELRLEILEYRIEALMNCGGESAALAELEALVLAYPMREMLSGQLMRMLYRAGRQADALAVYRRLRETLIEELGLEPTGPMQRLHQQILSGDAVLLADGRRNDRPPAVTRTSTLQVPRPSGTLIGRDDELAALRAAFWQAGPGQGSGAVVVIDGMAGTGKSALAIEAAYQLADRFPDGQLYLDMRGSTPGTVPLTPLGALRQLLLAMGESGQVSLTDPAEASAMLRSRLANHRLLIVLDNTDDADQIASVLSAGPVCAFLITSRRMIATLDGATYVHIHPLPEREANALLGEFIGAARVAAEPDAVSAITALCDGLPLALRIVGARLVARPGWSLRVFAERLADSRTRLDQLQAGKLGVRAAFEVSYQALENSGDPVDQLAASVFRIMGLLDESSVGVPVVATLVAQSSAKTEASLERLVDMRLAEEAGPGRYHLRDLLRLYAWEKAGSARRLKISELADGHATMDLVQAARACRATGRAM